MVGLVTLDDVATRVVKAMVDLYRGRVASPPEEPGLDAVVRITGIPPGHVRAVLERFGVKGVFGRGRLVVTPAIIESMEAHVDMPLAPSSPTSSQHFSVTAGAGSQVQVGHQVSGTQTQATYEGVLRSLQRAIESSAFPAEKKQAALELLDTLQANEAVRELLKLPAHASAKG